MAAQYSLAEQAPGRFLLGLGVSHGMVVEWRGHVYQKPLEAMRKATFIAADGETVAVRLVEALRQRAVVMWRTHADRMPDEAAALSVLALADLHDAAEQAGAPWTLLLDEFGAVIKMAAQRGVAEQIQLQYFESVPFLPLCRMQQPMAFRSDIRDVVSASFPVFWGVRRT